jgi:NitT/TauT family transport system permease protein
MWKPKHLLHQAALIVGLLALWELVAKLGNWPPHLFPDPTSVAASMAGMIADGRLGSAAVRSLGRLFEGYFISICIGVPLGIGIARSTALRMALKSVGIGLQALPSICWLPLAVLWFGRSEAAILFVVVMGSLLAISIATEDSVTSIQPQLILAAGTLGIRGLRFYGGVLVPAALPGIVSGLKLGWSFAWRALMAGELLFVSGGLGRLLTAAREVPDVPQIVAVMIAIIALGTLMDRLLFQTVETRVRQRWGLLAAS